MTDVAAPTPSSRASDDRLILVTGASGYIGGRLTTALLEQGRRVRVMARRPEKLLRRMDGWEGAQAVRGDVFDEDSLVEALAGVHTAYYLIHSMTTTAHEEDLEARDVLAAQTFARACQRASVKRIIYLGGIGGAQDERSAHLRSRVATGTALRSMDVPVTELRAAIIVGSGSASFQIIQDLVQKLPVMITPRWVRSRCEPVGIRTVLAYLTDCLDEPRTIGETLDIGSGDVLTYRRMMEITAEEMGVSVRIFTVPLLTPRLSSYWISLVSKVPMSLVRPLAEGLRSDVVTKDQRIRDWIDAPRLDFRECVRRALKKEREHTYETSWMDATLGFLRPIPSADAKMFKDERTRLAKASPEATFRVVQRIGGKSGWYYGNWLWRLRGIMDWLMGGVGMRRGRRHPENLHVGDPLDFWRVEELEPNRYLLLRAEMWVPGIAQLEFEVTPREEGGSILQQRARFWPQGLAGRLYWWSVAPLHFFIFRGMAREIVKRAERLERRRSAKSEGGREKL